MPAIAVGMATGELVTLPDRVQDVPEWDRGPLTGRLIQGRYLIKGLLGEGGMGSVYRAEHTLMGKELAIKVLLPELSREESIARRFQQEAQSASRLDHPGIIQVFDFGATEEGNLFLVMTLLTGQSLSRAIHHDAPLAPARAIAIAAQVAEALHHAHAVGVVHRDMKPDNVMLIEREKGELVKLLDFGIARVTEGEGAAKGMTELGTVFGTPEYLSPEQAVGDPADARSDLYALGVILYEMLAGKRPFEEETPTAYMQAHLRKPVPKFSERVPGLVLPPALQNVTLKALAKSPADRYQSGQAFADALRSLQLAPFALPASALVSLPGERGAPSSGGTTPTVPEAAASPGPGQEAPPAAPRPSEVREPGAAEGASRPAPASFEPPGLSRALKVWGLLGLGLVLLLLAVSLAVIAGSEEKGGEGSDGTSAPVRRDAAALKETLDLATLLPEAERLLSEKKWDRAEAKLQSMLGRWPRDPRIHLLLGQLHQARGNVAACLASYQSVLLLDPSRREDATLLKGLTALLKSRVGPEEGRATREAAVNFVAGPFAAGAPLGAAARRALATFVNRSTEHDLVWKLLAVLDRQKALDGVDLVRAYRLRFQSVKGCDERLRFLDEIVVRQDRKLLPLVEELHGKPELPGPGGEGVVSNDCLKEAAAKAILALGGELPAEPRRRPTRRRRRR